MPNLFCHPTGQVGKLYIVYLASGVLKQVLHDVILY